MSAASNAARSAHHAVKATTKVAKDAAQKPSSTLLNFIYEQHPKPLNCTTFHATRAIVEDPSHPFYIRTQRRLKAFDPQKLYWRVHVHIDVSKKAAIRSWAKKRIRRAFAKELETQGFNEDGTVKEDQAEKKSPVGGAVLILLPKDAKRALAFTDEDAHKSVAFVLRQVLQRHEAALLKGRGSASSKLNQKPPRQKGPRPHQESQVERKPRKPAPKPQPRSTMEASPGTPTPLQQLAADYYQTA